MLTPMRAPPLLLNWPPVLIVRVPDYPAWAPIYMPMRFGWSNSVVLTNAPPETVTVPVPASPIVSAPLLFQLEPLPDKVTAPVDPLC